MSAAPMHPADGDAQDDALLTLADAAERLDVHYMTAYRYVRTGRLHATKRAGQWWVNEDDLAAVSLSRSPAADDVPAEVGSAGSEPEPRAIAGHARYAEMIERRLVAADESGVWAIVSEALAGGASPAEVHINIVSPAMANIGQRWADGELSIADEHQASATLLRVLGRMSPLFRRRGRRRGHIIVGSVANDQHLLPSSLMADLLRSRGFDVTDLGANTPAESFVQVAESIDGRVALGLCCTSDLAADDLRRAVSHIREARPDLPLFVGGRVGGAIGQELDVTGAATSGEEALTMFDTALNV